MHRDLELRVRVAHTDAVRRVLAKVVDPVAMDDLFFLEDWEEQPVLSFAALLRVRRIQLAQPALAAEVHAEIIGRQHASPTRVRPW